MEIPLNVTFEVLASRYEMKPADRKHRIMVADDEPTCWDFAENTGNRVNDEFGFTKIMQFAFAKSCPSQGPHLPESRSKPVNANKAIIEVDFGISGMRHYECLREPYDTGTGRHCLLQSMCREERR